MPRLTAVHLSLDRGLVVRFTTTQALLAATDTAALIVSEQSGSELSIRLERGTVMDVHLWDSSRQIRQGLPVDNVTIADETIRCFVPAEVLPHGIYQPRLVAALVVNGALVQARFPVSFPALARPESRAPAPITRRSMRDASYRAVSSVAPTRSAIDLP